MAALAGLQPDDPPTLVFAHHFGGAGRSWRLLAQILNLSFACRTPDLAGFGGSTGPLELNLQAYAFQLEAVSDRPYVLVGHSMGAKMAMMVAANTPPRLRGLVLIAPSPPTPEPMEDGERRAFLAEFGDTAKARARINGLTHADLGAELMSAFVEDQVSVDAKVWRWWLEEGSKMDISSSLGGLDLPVLVVAAADDPVVPLPTSSQVAKGFTGASLQVLGACGHLAPVEQPDGLANMITEFVRSL